MGGGLTDLYFEDWGHFKEASKRVLYLIESLLKKRWGEIFYTTTTGLFKGRIEEHHNITSKERIITSRST